MKTYRFALIILCVCAGQAAAQTVNFSPRQANGGGANTIDPKTAESMIRWTIAGGCGSIEDHPWISPCPSCTYSAGEGLLSWFFGGILGPTGPKGCQGCGTGAGVPNIFSTWPFFTAGQSPGSTILNSLFTFGRSIIHNNRSHYVHWATDIKPTHTSPLTLRRYHMSRRHDWPSSFGPRVFSNYDIRMRFTEMGSAELMDPNIMEIIEFTSNYDYISTDPDGGNFEYRPQNMSRIRVVRMLDSNMDPVFSPQDMSSSAYAELETWSGEKFLFDLQVDPVYGQYSDFRWGRLRKISDARGYSLEVNYSADFKISTVEDMAGQTLQFTYETFEVGGSPAVKTVTNTDGKVTTYTYADTHHAIAEHEPGSQQTLRSGDAFDADTDPDHLASVIHPDSLGVSTFTTSFHYATGLTIEQYSDVTADQGHQNKSVYLTPLFLSVYYGWEREPLIPAAAGGVRMVVAGGEVGYLDLGFLGYPSAPGRLIYEGGGKLKVIHIGNLGNDPGVPYSGKMLSVRYYEDDWTMTIPEPWWDDYDDERDDPNVPTGTDVIAGQNDGEALGAKNGFYDGMLDLAFDNSIDPGTTNTDYLDSSTINGEPYDGFTYAYEFAYETAYHNGQETTWDYSPEIVVNGSMEEHFDALIANNAELIQAGRPQWRLFKDGTFQEFEFDSEGRVSHIHYRNDTNLNDDTFESFCYDSSGHMTHKRDREAGAVHMEYDADGNMTKRSVGWTAGSGAPGDPYGGQGCGSSDTQTAEYAEEQWVYTPSSTGDRLTAKIDFLGNQTDYSYNTLGQLTSIQSPADTSGGARPTTTFTYNSAGRVDTKTDAEGNDVSYFYDSLGRVTSTLFDDGTSQKTFYTGGNVVKTIDRGGVVTTMEYDAADRLVKRTTAAAQVVSGVETPTPEIASIEEFEYELGSTWANIVTRNGARTESYYDYKGRKTETTVYPRAGKSLTSKMTYDGNHLFCSEDPYGRKSYYAYDATDGRMIRSVQGTVPEFSLADYDAVLNLTRDSSPNADYIITDTIFTPNGNVESSFDGRGTETTYEYDSRDRQTATVAAVGTAVETRSETIYDLADNVLERRSPRYFDASDSMGYNLASETWTYTYRGLAATRTEAAGGTGTAVTESLVYDELGRQTQRTDFAGKVWKTHYDDCCGKVVSTENPLGHGSISRKDSRGQTVHAIAVGTLASHTDLANPLDNETYREVTIRYDGLGRPIARTTWLTARGSVDVSNPPIAGWESIAASEGLTEQFFYDDNLSDGASFTVNKLDGSGTYSVSLANALTKLADSQANGGAGVSFDADAPGSARVLVNPDEEISFSISDSVGRSVMSGILAPHDGTNPNELITWSTSLHDATLSIVGYGTVLESRSINPLGHAHKIHSDGAGRTIQSLDALDKVTTFTYDASGNRFSVRDPNNVGQDYAYDEFGRLQNSIDLVGNTTSYTYDHSGNMLSWTDAKNKTFSYEYDARGRLSEQTDRNGATTVFSFSPIGKLSAISDAQGQTTHYTYDDIGCKTSQEYPDHISGTSPGNAGCGIVTFTYDPLGRVRTRVDQTGNTVTNNFDLAGRLASRVYPGGTDSFTYDASQRILTAVSGRYGNSVNVAYDNAGRKKEEELVIGGQSYGIATSYNTAGQVAGYTYPDGTSISRTYTDRGQLDTVNVGAETIDARTYDDAGRLLTSTYGNGVSQTRSYNNDNTLASITHSGASIGTYTYGWDDNKNKTNETITGTLSGRGFTVGMGGYDNEGRLINWNRSDSNLDQSWTLSLVGDWTSFTENSSTQNRTHGPTHELTAVDSNPISADSRGNMTIIPAYLRSGSDPLNLTWDVDNRLSSADVDNDNSDDVTYKFDALGRRIARTDSSGTTVYVMNGQQTLLDYSLGSAPASPEYSYVYASYIDEPVLRLNHTADKRYFHHNQHYSVIALTDHTGSVKEHYSYDAYGNVTFHNPGGSVRASSGESNRYTYTGREWDEDLELYHYRARMYDPKSGRFISRDPITYSDSFNMHQFCLGRPVSSVDPTGLYCTWEIHHWFPTEHHSKIEALCPGLPNMVHAFGSVLPRCYKESKNSICNHHGYLHNQGQSPMKPTYNARVGGALSRSKNCCEFLIKMEGVISRAWKAIKGRDTACRGKMKLGCNKDTPRIPYMIPHQNFPLFRDGRYDMDYHVPYLTQHMLQQAIRDCKRGKNPRFDMVKEYHVWWMQDEYEGGGIISVPLDPFVSCRLIRIGAGVLRRVCRKVLSPSNPPSTQPSTTPQPNPFQTPPPQSPNAPTPAPSHGTPTPSISPSIAA